MLVIALVLDVFLLHYDYEHEQDHKVRVCL
jgi:hypothetical protein